MKWVAWFWPFSRYVNVLSGISCALAWKLELFLGLALMRRAGLAGSDMLQPAR
jgi:hypothetical protein